MPGRQIKDWNVYHALRRKSYSKSKSARIANSQARRKRRKRRR